MIESRTTLTPVISSRPCQLRRPGRSFTANVPTLLGRNGKRPTSSNRSPEQAVHELLFAIQRRAEIGGVPLVGEIEHHRHDPWLAVGMGLELVVLEVTHKKHRRKRIALDHLFRRAVQPQRDVLLQRPVDRLLDLAGQERGRDVLPDRAEGLRYAIHLSIGQREPVARRLAGRVLPALDVDGLVAIAGGHAAPQVRIHIVRKRAGQMKMLERLVHDGAAADALCKVAGDFAGALGALFEKDFAHDDPRLLAAVSGSRSAA